MTENGAWNVGVNVLRAGVDDERGMTAGRRLGVRDVLVVRWWWVAVLYPVEPSSAASFLPLALLPSVTLYGGCACRHCPSLLLFCSSFLTFCLFMCPGVNFSIPSST
jgi:hypothetical protein